jgi:hypothetical protein
VLQSFIVQRCSSFRRRPSEEEGNLDYPAAG